MTNHSHTEPANTPSPEGEGNIFERILFKNRLFFLLFFILLTIFLGYQAIQLKPEASFLRMIPTYHPYIQNYMAHQEDLQSLGNHVLISIETTEGDIFSKKYMEVLKQAHDEVFFIPGVGRGFLKSLWAPATRWTQVTSEGFEGGPVIPDGYDGSPESLHQLRANVLRSGEIGTMVAQNFKSSIIYVPVQDYNPETGKPIDYREFANTLESIRDKYQSDTIKVHITGFAKLVGDLIEGSTQVLIFFVITFVILIFFLYLTSRDLRSTSVRGVVSLAAVIWQLGVLSLFGYGLNPYSMLVPFLTFALVVSHGIQISNAMVYEMSAGADKLQAARFAFRKLLLPGFSALFTDAVGFATLFFIFIGVIQDIAVGATIGVVAVAFADLMMLPVLLSYTGISEKGLAHRRRSLEASSVHQMISFASQAIRRKPATIIAIVTIIAFGCGFYIKKDLKIGDLDPGSPELRQNSRYNRDAAFMNENYSATSDVFVIMMKTPPAGNSNYNAQVAMDRLSWELSRLDCTESVRSIVGVTKSLNAGWSEGFLKWFALPRSKDALDNMATKAPANLTNSDGSLTPILVYLKDHKAETLTKLTDIVENFAKENNSENFQFLLAAGSAGIEAATNIEIEKAQIKMTLLVYGVVFLVCLFTFRSLRLTIATLIPLYLISVLCETLMTLLGIGIKVSTLPVIAVGAGIGVDYAIYTCTSLQQNLRQGYKIDQALFLTLNTTGRAVLFTGTTLALGVGLWIFSPIKFQADMGLLLTFMFIGNMIGALTILPAFTRITGFAGKLRTAATSSV